MKSSLNASDFKKKLKNNTKQGSIWDRFSPFAIFHFFKEYEKVFLGEFSNGNFDLTKNTITASFPYRIKGTYTPINEYECEIEYTVKPILLLLLNTIISFIIGVGFTFVVGFVLFVNKGFLFGISGLIIVGVLTIGLPIFIQKRNKRNVETAFKRIFKITES